jgi:uncharacterized tellurite resistance protein B-like protein
MIVAYSDEAINENEINLIKDYFYESCLTEEEWREIDSYRIRKPRKNEIQDIIDNVLTQIKNSKDKDEFFNSIKEIINVDGVLKDEETEILTILQNKIDSTSYTKFNSIYRRIKHIEMNPDYSAIEDAKNPIAVILYEVLGESELINLEVSAAKIGLALIVIYSDSNFDDIEKSALKEFIKNECKIDNDLLNQVFSKLLQIPENYFEMAYLSRIITNSTEETERLALLIELFKIARANRIYDDYEDKYLRLIAQFLFISEGDFQAIKAM